MAKKKTRESILADESSDDTAPLPPPAPKEVKKAVAAQKVAVPAKEESETETESESDDSSTEVVKAPEPPPPPPKKPNKVVKKEDKGKERENLKEKERDNKEKETKAARKAKKRQSVDRSSEETDTVVAPPPPPPPPPAVPAPAAPASQAQQQQQQDKDGAGTDAPQQPKSGPKKGLWVAKDESILAQQMLDDLKAGSDFHDKPKTDPYWEELCHSLKGKLSTDFTKEQIFDKHRRMKAKFDKYESSKPGGRKRSQAVDALQAVFKQLWGRDLPADHAGEDSNGDVEMTPAKKGGEDRVGDELKAALKGGDGGTAMSSDPVLTIAASLLHSVMASHKLGSELTKAGSRESRKRNLEDQIAEYSSMKRRLKLAMDYCEVEEELLEKKLNTI
ncbi:transcription initiation factor TFIID subunit 11-like [Selaginella moellendorffii]|uniref:transcription initiation factor TFIID subunit 11-like n=1 Tax=Selaginella moellendorffii TaxID=88036 RepID=UPI000D1D0E53|nr:transcription initiation factor TFIID subunit 11-like [Selaginella moellendorffii]|eukprot:XP_024523388.1 transcription initiation factor TFIID subunit 11-like [Selaginella moellendorffii]